MKTETLASANRRTPLRLPPGLPVLFIWFSATVLGLAQPLATIQFSANSYTVSEGAGTVTLSVQRTNDVDTIVSVDYATADGTATNRLKYTAVSGTLQFLAGETNQPIVVPILNEGLVEGTKTFRVVLTNPSEGAVLGTRATATANITDNDSGIRLIGPVYNVTEEAGCVGIGVVRGDDGDYPVTVDFKTANVTAMAGIDYEGVTNTLTFPAGETFKLVDIAILNDAVRESSKSFRVTLSKPTGGAQLGSPTQATVTIANTDEVVQLEYGNYDAGEETGFIRIGVLRGENDTDATVDFRTSDSTAKAGLDYGGLTNTLTFAPGERLKLIDVPILSDELKESDETFGVILSKPTGGAVLGTPSSATVTILDNSPRVQPAPHHFTGLTVLPDQTVTLSLDGSVSNMFNLTGTISNQFQQMFDLYLVEASTNLLDWTRLALLLRTNNDPNPLLFHDTNAASFSQRFYRTSTNHLLTALPKPSGPFTVGTVDRVMTDPARTNRCRYTPATNAFMVTFWYPADPPGPGVLPAAMWDQGWAADMNCYTTFLGSFDMNDIRWFRICPKLVGHRFRNLPVASGTAKYPVVLFSAGGWFNRTGASQDAEELASHGYVVVVIEPTDSWGTTFPDGRYLLGHSMAETDVATRLQDMRFLLDEIAVLDREDSLFQGRLDLERIGVFGESSGGIVIETARAESRVKCAAIWDGDSFTVTAPGLQKPFLAALGESNFSYDLAQWLFNQATTNAILLQVRGAHHATGCDLAWSWQVPWGRKPALAIDACLVWFFDTYLKGEAPPFPTNPEIYNVQRK